MIILDTNVVSEPMKPRGDPAVQVWLDDQLAESLYLTATSLSELLLGIELLPDGQRKDGLAVALTELLEHLFGPRILPFDERAAAAFAPLIRRTRAAGQTLSVADAQIAAIAMVHGFSVATRDTAPFAAAGVPIINPWNTEGPTS
ncbi:MAG: type II toxin-antitoxin system VapC family toxin [Steroidobacteraceae bacterium]